MSWSFLLRRLLLAIPTLFGVVQLQPVAPWVCAVASARVWTAPRGSVRIAPMDANLAGFVALGALILGLFAWLRQDIRALRTEMNALRTELRTEMNGLRTEMSDRIDGLRAEMNELRERVARIEGLLEAVFMRRDLTPVPEPPLPEPPGKSQAA